MSLALRRLVFSGFAFWLAVGVLAFYLIWPLRERLRFGIDLVGGTYITLEVQTDKAIEAELVDRINPIVNKLKNAGRALPTTKVVNEGALVLTFESPDTARSAALQLKTDEPQLLQKVENDTVRLELPAGKKEAIMREAVERNINVLHTRINKLGVSETPIAAQGERNIIVELPNVDDPQQAKSIIGRAAVLEFKIVEKEGASKDDIRFEFDGDIPDDMEIYPGKSDADGNIRRYYLLPKYTQMTGRLLKDAYPEFDQQGRMVVNFQWSPEGGDKFYDLTSKNHGRQLAIVLDGVVIQAPTIQASIRTSGNITGGFSQTEARDLSLLLKSGSFVAPVTFEEERQVGPLLGQESIRKGLISCLVGLGLVLLFAVIYYKLAGFFAFFALAYNLLLILFGLSELGATLTLPGIAGMVLTVGMAIDASILIYERIKEELAAGLTVKKAVSAGFSDAMVVILDANITTFIVGVMLYSFGTGPIKGFAVTMMLGIVSTLITGLFFLRSLFNAYLNTFNVQKLKI